MGTGMVRDILGGPGPARSVAFRAAGALPTEGEKTQVHAQGLPPPHPRAIAQAPLGLRRSKEGGCAAQTSQARGRRTTPPPPFSSAPAVPHLLSPPPFFPSREQEQKGTGSDTAPKPDRLRHRKTRLSPPRRGNWGRGRGGRGKRGREENRRRRRGFASRPRLAQPRRSRFRSSKPTGV